MKKTTTFLLLLIPFIFFAQVPKMVLYEGVSSGSCPPCATANPGINSLIESNLDKVVPIKYQVQVGPGDPMYFHNPNEANARSNYYNVSGVPTSRLNGESNVSFNQTNINSRYNTNAQFTIDIDAEMSLTLDTVHVEVKITALADLNLASLVAQIAVVEKEIIFETPPGTNGETRFTYIMRKFIPGTNGNAIPQNISDGDEFTFSGFWVHENIYDISELAVVAWVQQNNTAKTVHQAGIQNVRITLENNLDAALLDATVLEGNFATDDVCDYTVSPVVEFRNLGNNDITELTFRYRVNEGSFRTYTWTGNAATFDKTKITLPSVPFFHNASGINQLEVEVVDANGEVDQDLTNNTFVQSFNTAKNSSTQVTMTISHDQYGDEITWQLKRLSDNQVMYSGGPYASGTAGNKQETFNLTSGDCYEYTIFDSYGDAQLGAATGVTLFDMVNNVNLLTNFNGYGFEGKFNFGVNADQSTLVPDSSEVFLSIKNVELINVFNVFPNPAQDLLNVQLTTKGAKELTVELIDIMGRKLAVKETVNGKASFAVSNYSKGIYFVNVVDNGASVATSRVVIAR